MSTTQLRAATDITTTNAAHQVAAVLANLGSCGVFSLTTAESLLADLAAADEPGDDGSRLQ